MIPHQDSKFTNSNGMYRTMTLFWETCSADEKDLALYTLKAQDHQGLPSLKRLYLEQEDLTEYTFATTHLADWEHWERLCEAPWFQKHVEAWRRELALKLKSEAVLRVLHESRAGGKNSFACNKWIVDKGYVGEDTKSSSKRGRPSKQEVHEEVQKQVNRQKQIQEDFERMFN